VEGYLASALVAVLIGIATWQWNLNRTLTKKADADEVSKRHHDLRNEVQARMAMIEADSSKLHLSMYRDFVSKDEHHKNMARIDERFDTQDEKLDRLLIETTKVSTQLQKALT